MYENHHSKSVLSTEFLSIPLESLVENALQMQELEEEKGGEMKEVFEEATAVAEEEDDSCERLCLTCYLS